MILVEGNIAAGKTELGHTLEASGQFAFIPEPVEEWRQAGLLELFYSDPKRWAFTFQIAAFGTRAKNWNEVLELTDHSRVVLERSIYTDRHVFALNCFRTGLMSRVEYETYCCLWDFLAANWCVTPNHIIYLRTPPEVCLHRIVQRGRPEELNITLEYLQQLQSLHDEWLLVQKDVVVLDATRRWTADEIARRLEENQPYPTDARYCV